MIVLRLSGSSALITENQIFCSAPREADQIANELARQQAEFELLEVNILSNPDLYKRYKNAIPVVLLNGREVFRFRLTADGLLQRLRDRGQN